MLGAPHADIASVVSGGQKNNTKSNILDFRFSSSIARNMVLQNTGELCTFFRGEKYQINRKKCGFLITR